VIAELILLLGKLPLPSRRTLGSCLGSLLFFMPTREKKIARLQMARFLGPGGGQSARRVFANLGVTLFESIGLQKLCDRAPVELFLNGELIDEQRLVHEFSISEHSYLALTGHTGNWDFLAAYFSKLGMPITAIGRRANRMSWQIVLERVREQAQITTLWRDDTKSARKIIEALKGNCFLAALLDQDIDAPGISVNFFGEPAHYASGLVGLAIKLNVPIVSVFGARTKRGGFCFFIERFSPDQSQSEAMVLEEYGRRLEKVIRLYPEQWVWNHKRWRTLPDGRRRSSKEYLQWLEQWV
jgi:Kdo2-lipid IVA lauroyltransferase/acyltransferase